MEQLLLSWHMTSIFQIHEIKDIHRPLWCHIVCCAALRLRNWSWFRMWESPWNEHSRESFTCSVPALLSHHGHSWFKLSNSWGQDWEFFIRGVNQIPLACCLDGQLQTLVARGLICLLAIFKSLNALSMCFLYFPGLLSTIQVDWSI